MTWRAPYFDLASGLFVPRLVTWGSGDPQVHERRGLAGCR